MASPCRHTHWEPLWLPGWGWTMGTKPGDVQLCSSARCWCVGKGALVPTTLMCQSLQSTKWKLAVGVDTSRPFFRRYPGRTGEGQVKFLLKNWIWLGCCNFLLIAMMESETAFKQRTDGELPVKSRLYLLLPRGPKMLQLPSRQPSCSTAISSSHMWKAMENQIPSLYFLLVDINHHFTSSLVDINHEVST